MYLGVACFLDPRYRLADHIATIHPITQDEIIDSVMDMAMGPLSNSDETLSSLESLSGHVSSSQELRADNDSETSTGGKKHIFVIQHCSTQFVRK